ncbi:MAG: mechanosensitive ion channel family protein [Spirochaetaceae bacterium]|jgi:MscS family membrane protein|nr:mechanosensitive ion channel family protein [Spirochaetaceae bacterium]
MEKLKTLLVETTGHQLAEAILLSAGGIIAGIIFSTIIHKLIVGVTAKTKNRLDDVIAAYIRTPLALLMAICGIALGLEKLSFSKTGQYWKDKIIFAVIICIACWTIMKILDAVISKYAPRTGTKDSTFTPVFRRLINIMMVILPAAIIAKSLGYDISAVLAGLGIGGAALALAARDILASFFGSLAVLADKPFHVGDRVRFVDKNYEAIDGIITEIRFRTTRLKTFDNRIVVIPNSIFSAFPVQNVSTEPHTRVVQTISIRASNGYAKTTEAVAILESLSPANTHFGSPHIATVVYVGIAVYKINFIFFIAAGEDYFGTVNAVNLEIIRRFEEAGIFF